MRGWRFSSPLICCDTGAEFSESFPGTAWRGYTEALIIRQFNWDDRLGQPLPVETIGEQVCAIRFLDRFPVRP